MNGIALNMGSFRTAFIGLLLVCFCAGIRGAWGHTKYKDPSRKVSLRIRDLLRQMTLAEKIGQMTQIERANASCDVMKNYFIGSILSAGGSTPGPKASAEQWVNMVNEMQKSALSTRLGIPMLYGVDAVHGHNNVYGATIFPHNIGLGCTRDPKLMGDIGAATALEVRATGIPYAFAPCFAVCRDPRWGRCYESFSEDTDTVKMMVDSILGLQGHVPKTYPEGTPFIGGKKNVAACAKHYVGDGGTQNGINEGNTIIDRQGLFRIHMPPYYKAISHGVASIMISFSSWNGEKMHANKNLITNFLKKNLHFRGFVISDWTGIDKITDPPHSNYTHSVYASINAGIDMVMVGYSYAEFIDELTRLVQSNAIPMSRIDDAVKRILRIKFTLGLFDQPYADLSLKDHLGSQEHRELARQAVRKSLVLLKNGKSTEKPFLPLPKKAPNGKILVAGSHADNLGYQCGGWTIEWQGLAGNDLTQGTTILGGIKATVDPSTEVVYNENPDANFLKNCDYSYAIVVVGEYPYAETFGDSQNLSIPGTSTIDSVCSVIPCVVVLVTGRPVVMEPYVAKMEALVAAWLPGTEGQGVADVLFGDYGFTGKLSKTWFKSVDQLPMNVGDPSYDPLFPFGFGLTTNPTNAKKDCA